MSDNRPSRARNDSWRAASILTTNCLHRAAKDEELFSNSEPKSDSEPNTEDSIQCGENGNSLAALEAVGLAPTYPRLTEFNISVSVEGVAAPSGEVAIQLVREHISSQFKVRDAKCIAGESTHHQVNILTAAVCAGEQRPVVTTLANPIAPDRSAQSPETRERPSAVSAPTHHDPDWLRAQMKFNQFDTARRGYLQRAEIKRLAEWVWNGFHMQPTTPVEIESLQTKLMAQMGSVHEERIYLKEFIPWYQKTHRLLTKHKESMVTVTELIRRDTGTLSFPIMTLSPLADAARKEAPNEDTNDDQIHLEIGVHLSEMGIEVPHTPQCCNWKPLLLGLAFALLLLGLQFGLWKMLLEMVNSSVSSVGQKYLRALAGHAELATHAVFDHARNCVRTIELAANTSEIRGLSTSIVTVAGEVTSSLVNNPCFLSAYVAGLIRVTPELDWIGVGLEDGSMYSATRLASGQVVALIKDAQNILGQGTSLRKYSLDSLTGCYNLSAHVPTDHWGGTETEFDPRLRPWYSTTKTKKRASWIEYPHFEVDDLVKTVTMPLWDKSRRRFIGVIAADVLMSGVSDILNRIPAGKHGIVFMTETNSNVVVLSNSDTGSSHVPMQDSEDERIRNSYKYSSDMSQTDEVSSVTSSQWSSGKFPASVYGGAPGGMGTTSKQMVGKQRYNDFTTDFDARLWIVIPAADFYGFVDSVNILSICCTIMVGILMVFFVQQASKLSSLSQRNGWKKVATPVICSFVLGALQVFVWLVVAKAGIDDITEHVLVHRRRYLADIVEFAGACKIHRATVTSMVYQITQQIKNPNTSGNLWLNTSGLPLGAESVLFMQPNFDLHLYSSLLLDSDLTMTYIGFQTGEYYAMRRQCHYTMQCNRADEQDLVWALSAGKNRDRYYDPAYTLKAYHVTDDPLGSRSKVSMRPPNQCGIETDCAINGSLKQIADLGAYTPYTQDWYKEAVANGPMTCNHTRFGVPVVSTHMDYTDGGTVMIRSSQAFYDEDGVLVGVIGSATTVDRLSFILQTEMTDEESSSVLVAQFGEVVAASNGVTSLPTTGGGHTNMIVTSSPMDNIADFAASEWQGNNTSGDPLGDSIRSTSGWVDLSSNSLKAAGRLLPATAACHDKTSDVTGGNATSCLGTADRYTLNQAICRLSLIQIIPRHVYFSNLDALMSQLFTCIVFGFALFFYLIVSFFTKSRDLLDAMGVVSNPTLQAKQQFHKRKMKDSAMLVGIRTQIQPMKERWSEECYWSEESYRNEKAVQYMNLADQGRDVVQTFTLESRFSQDSVQFLIFYFLDSKKCRSLLLLLLVVFVLLEFMPDDGGHRWHADFALLFVFTIQSLLKEIALADSWSVRTLKRWATISMFWGLLIVELSSGMHMIGPFRPILPMVKSRGVRAMIKLIWECIYSARVILVLFLTVVAVTAVMATLLFSTKFDDATGKTVDNFLDSYVAMFVFLVSLENYGLVYQGYDVTRLSCMFFIPVGVIGMFFLTSMVIARFELAYTKYQKISSEFNLTQRRFAIAVAFAMSTDNELRAHTFVKLMTLYWNSRGVNLDGIRDRMLEIQMTQSDVSKGDEDVNSPSGPLMAAALMIFDMIDRDNSNSISFHEFQLVVAVSECVAVISSNPIVGYQTIICRMELLLKDCWLKMAKLASDKTKAQTRVLDQISRHEFIFEQAVDQLGQYKARIHGSMRLTRYFSMASLDQATIVMLVSHMFVLSLYGTTSNPDWLKTTQLVFCVFYTLEMCCRLVAAKGWTKFCDDPRGSVHSFRNVSTFIFWLIGLITTVIALNSDRNNQGFWTAVSSLTLWRIFVVSEAFRDIIHNTCRGFGAISYFVLVFMIFFYFYGFAAHKLFENVNFGGGHVDFSTLSSSCLTMAQVCLGEGWHDIMYGISDRSNKIAVWFFASFVFLVLFLFSQLIVGFVIQMFQSYEGMRSTTFGQCKLALMAPLADTDDEDRKDLLKELGRISSILYAPALLHFARLQPYEEKILTYFHGDEQAWAGSLLASGFRKRDNYRWLATLRSSLTVLTTSGKWTRRQLVTLLHDAYIQCGLDCNNAIEGMEHLFAVMKQACMGFDDNVAELILRDLIRGVRASSSTQMLNLRRGHPTYHHPAIRPWSFLCMTSFVTHRLAVFSGLNPDLVHMWRPADMLDVSELKRMHEVSRMHLERSLQLTTDDHHKFCTTSPSTTSSSHCFVANLRETETTTSSMIANLREMERQFDGFDDLTSLHIQKPPSSPHNPLFKDPRSGDRSLERRLLSSPSMTCQTGLQRTFSNLESGSPVFPIQMIRSNSSLSSQEHEKVASPPWLRI